MPDTSASLWRELFEKMDDPFFALELGGGVACWFCGMSTEDETQARHKPDCIWVRAKALDMTPEKVARKPFSHKRRRK